MEPELIAEAQPAPDPLPSLRPPTSLTAGRPALDLLPAVNMAVMAYVGVRIDNPLAWIAIGVGGAAYLGMEAAWRARYSPAKS